MGNRCLALIIAAAAVAAVALPPAAAQQPPASPVLAPGTPPSPTIPAVASVPVAAPRPVSLADAIATALQNNFQIRQSALSIVSQRATLRQAEAQKALTLGTSIAFTYNSVPTGGNRGSGEGLMSTAEPSPTALLASGKP